MQAADKTKAETKESNFDPYRLYLERATLDDRDFVKECNESMDTMMVFAGLFSAAITQFIATTSTLLQPDRQEQSNDLLVTLIMVAKDPSSADISHVTSLPDFQPSTQAVAINSLFFFSLILSLLSALGAMLVKQLARRYESHGTSQVLPWKMARIREQKRIALKAWHVEEVIAFIPMLLHVALVLFLSGVLIWTSVLSRGSLIPSTALASLAALLYIILATAPSVSEDAPFQWPASSGVKTLVQALRKLTENSTQGTSTSRIESRPSSASGGAFRWLKTRSVWRKMAGPVDAIVLKLKPKDPELEIERGPEPLLPRGSSSQVNDNGVLQQTRVNATSGPETTAEPSVKQRHALAQISPQSPELIGTLRHSSKVAQPMREQPRILLPIDTGDVAFITTPSDVSQSHKEQLYPPSYESLDLLILINLVRGAEVNEELVYIFETIRTANWGLVKVADLLATHGEVVLQRCGSVSATTWFLSGGRPKIREPLRGRARQMCLFIEWFYYQLTVQQRRALDNWPHSGVATGLIRDEWRKTNVENAPEVSLDDLLLGTSVIAKLHHVRLTERDVCDRCVTQAEPDQHDIRMRLRLKNFLLPNGGVDYDKRELAKEMQAKVSAIISSDTECLLHYIGALPDEQLTNRIKVSTTVLLRRVHMYISSVGERKSFARLREMMGALQDKLPEGDPRLLWFTQIWDGISIEGALRAQAFHRRDD